MANCIFSTCGFPLVGLNLKLVISSDLGLLTFEKLIPLNSRQNSIFF